MNSIPAWQQPEAVRRAMNLLRSYQRWLDADLLPGISLAATASESDKLVAAERLFSAPFVVVAHGTEADPILNYGNQTALELWELDWSEFCQTPSRKTAEPMHRDERARLLARTKADGYVDDYQGIRISSQGRRFRIDQAIVWNVVDETERLIGQAATFSDWTFLS